ncbi:MAG: VOC family protein [Pseudomonadota bacterium]
MIGYITIGTDDISRAAAFYDELLASVNARRVMDFGTFILWGNKPGGCGLAITKPHDGNPATVGNGVMPAIMAESTAQVDEVYSRAIELGAIDEGAAGPRSEGFYAGYFRDLDGNKLCVYFTS